MAGVYEPEVGITNISISSMMSIIISIMIIIVVIIIIIIIIYSPASPRPATPCSGWRTRWRTTAVGDFQGCGLAMLGIGHLVPRMLLNSVNFSASSTRRIEGCLNSNYPPNSIIRMPQAEGRCSGCSSATPWAPSSPAPRCASSPPTAPARRGRDSSCYFDEFMLFFMFFFPYYYPLNFQTLSTTSTNIFQTRSSLLWRVVPALLLELAFAFYVLVARTERAVAAVGTLCMLVNLVIGSKQRDPNPKDSSLARTETSTAC